MTNNNDRFTWTKWDVEITSTRTKEETPAQSSDAEEAVVDYVKLFAEALRDPEIPILPS